METLIALDGLEFGIHFSIFEIGDSGIGCLLCAHPPFDPWLGQPISIVLSCPNPVAVAIKI